MSMKEWNLFRVTPAIRVCVDRLSRSQIACDAFHMSCTTLTSHNHELTLSHADASECSEQRQRQDTNTTDDAVSKVDDALLTFITLARTPLTAISCLLTSTFEHPRSSLEATAATTPVHISDGAASLGKWAELKQDDRVSSSEEPIITTAVTAAPTHDAENVEEEAASQPASYAPDSEWRCIDSWGLTEGEAQDIYELLAAKMQFSVNAGSPMRRRIVPHEPGQMSPIV